MSDELTPRNNPDLIGHEETEARLASAFQSGRLGHSWLICGPRGIGKATLAYRFARYVLAQGMGPGEDDGPGLFGEAPAAAPSTLAIPTDSPTFRRVSSSGHADLMVIERAFDEKKGKRKGEILVDDVRGVGSFLSMTAAEGGWRVVIVDAADEMNRNAANAILKVLEEPPKRALMLLVAHNPGRLLPTIRSRCRRLVLSPLPEEQVRGLLARYRPDLDPSDIAELARLAEGSPGRALDLADENKLELFRDLLAVLESLPNLDVAAAHAFGDKVARGGADDAFRTTAEMLRWWLARLIRAIAAGESDADGQGGAVTARLASVGNLEPWLQVWEKTDQLLARATGLELDRKQVILNALMALESAARR